MSKYKDLKCSGERALFNISDAYIDNCLFFDGESPLKECRNLDIHHSTFDWKYPLWYGNNITVQDSVITNTGRAGIWYSNNVKFLNTVIDGAKNFRRCNQLIIDHCDFSNALETLWHCFDVKLSNCQIKGDYLFLDSKNIYVDNIKLIGDYGFDSCENVEIHHSELHTKDAFWNCKNVVVYDSTIVGEYLAWNAQNITFINCHIESLQGLCYINNLKLVNCTMDNTTLSFEYSNNVDAEIKSTIDSIKNVGSGVIIAKKINEIIMDETKVDINKTKIIINEDL